VPHSNIILLFTFCAIALIRVTLVSRVTARSLYNNIVGYVPPSAERSCNKYVKPLSVGYKFVDTRLYYSRQWFNIHLVDSVTAWWQSRGQIQPLPLFNYVFLQLINLSNIFVHTVLHHFPYFVRKHFKQAFSSTFLLSRKNLI